MVDASVTACTHIGVRVDVLEVDLPHERIEVAFTQEVEIRTGGIPARRRVRRPPVGHFEGARRLHRVQPDRGEPVRHRLLVREPPTVGAEAIRGDLPRLRAIDEARHELRGIDDVQAHRVIAERHVARVRRDDRRKEPRLAIHGEQARRRIVIRRRHPADLLIARLIRDEVDRVVDGERHPALAHAR